MSRGYGWQLRPAEDKLTHHALDHQSILQPGHSLAELAGHSFTMQLSLYSMKLLTLAPFICLALAQEPERKPPVTPVSSSRES